MHVCNRWDARNRELYICKRSGKCTLVIVGMPETGKCTFVIDGMPGSGKCTFVIRWNARILDMHCTLVKMECQELGSVRV